MEVLTTGRNPAVLSCLPRRESGWQRFSTFLPGLSRYARERNFVYPDRFPVSRLSPYVRYRLVRETELVNQVLAKYDYRDVSKFLEEVCWRTYWKGYLEGHPGIWTDYREQVTLLPSTLTAEQAGEFQRACHGRTGIDCFDSWARELTSTGWLHNHVRMWFASIWIFTLRLPWQLGAAHFLQHLLDGDPASNILSWRWVAGLHTRGKHYLARADNINRFTGNAFHPVGRLNERARPLEEEAVYSREPFPRANTLSGSLFPCLSHCPAGLLVCPEDMTPEIGELAEMPFSSICVLNASDIMDSYAAAGPVRAFIDGAVVDTASRLAHHWGGQKLLVDGIVEPRLNQADPAHVGRWEQPRVYYGQVDQWVDSVLVWALNENLNSISLLQPPTGPWQEALPELRAALKARNVHLIEFRRRWDALHWPCADSGYFNFRKGLRERLSGLVEKD